MTKFLSSICGSLAVATVVVGVVYADTFEYLTYTVPSGWVKQSSTNYRRTNGIGAISFIASYATNASPTDEFSRMWRTRVEPTISVAAPRPQLERDGEYVAAVGVNQIQAKDAVMTVSLVTFVGRGRAIGVLVISSGDNVLGEVTAFLDSIKITPGSALPASAGPSSNGEVAVDFDVPPGYVQQRESGNVLLNPRAASNDTPCVYGLTPPRPSAGDLEKDARAAISGLFPEWRTRINSSYAAMRGIAGDGWPYFWYQTDVERQAAGGFENANVMATAFPGGEGQVNILWGIGNNARCRLDDINFLRIFHSLRPRGPASNAGAFAAQLPGTWRLTESSGLAQYVFKSGNRYEYALGTVTHFGLQSTTFSTVSDGRWGLIGSQLILTPDRAGRGVQKLRVRIFDETDSFSGRWKRVMSILDESAMTSMEVRYMRVEN